MSTIEIISLVITIICLLSFSITFTILFRNYYLSNIESVSEGRDDIALIDNAIDEERKKKSKPKRILKIILKVFSYCVLGVVVVGFGVSLYGRFTNNIMVFGNSTVVVVGSGSMSKKNSDNTYLLTQNLTNQFNTYDIIGISKYNDQNDIKKYDVVAYKNKEGTTIIHRIINVIDNKGDIEYVTRGDSNNASDTNVQYDGYLKYKDIIGFYNNTRIPNVGIFVVFLQSNAGIITLLAIIYCLFMFDHYSSKYQKAVNERTSKLIDIINFDISSNDVGDLNMHQFETLSYKGYIYYFEKGIFQKKEETKSEDSQTMVFCKTDKDGNVISKNSSLVANKSNENNNDIDNKLHK